MFTYVKKLQYTVRVDKPDPVFARKLQELLGGKWGEMSVMMQYLFQGWALRGDQDDPRMARLKDMLLDTGTEEIAHVEMLANCIGMLLNGASPRTQEDVADGNPFVLAQIGDMNPQHMIVAGLGALPVDSAGNPWSGAYISASGNVIADMYLNATAEMNGRLQACRMFELTDDPGVRDMLQFMIARDHMHQLQWLAAIEEFGGPTKGLPVPSSFPLEREKGEYAYAFMSYAQDPSMTRSGEGPWANGPAPDGKGTFNFIAEPFGIGEFPHLPQAPQSLWDAPPPDGQTMNASTAQGSGVSGSTMRGSRTQGSTTTEKGTAQKGAEKVVFTAGEPAVVTDSDTDTSNR